MFIIIIINIVIIIVIIIIIIIIIITIGFGYSEMWAQTLKKIAKTIEKDILKNGVRSNLKGGGGSEKEIC